MRNPDFRRYIIVGDIYFQTCFFLSRKNTCLHNIKIRYA